MNRITITGTITAADAGRRTIAGRIVTWDEEGSTSLGPTKFAKDSLAFDGDVVLAREHDTTSPLGRSTALTASDDGIDGVFRIAGTTAGNDALVEASEGLRSGLSVGASIEESHRDENGVLVITAATLDEVSLVTRPAIDSARVSDVAASENKEGNPDMNPEIETAENAEIEEIVEAENVTAAANLAPIRTEPRRVEFSSPADYVLTYVEAARGDSDAKRKITAANQTLADNPAIVPTPILGPVVTFLNSKRPVIAASRSVGLPSAGSQFIRPKVTQHTLVGKQAKELDPLASQTMKVTPINVTKSTYGGTIKLSFQDRDWTDPSILNLVITDMYANYGVQTDAAACATLTASAKAVQPLAADAKSDAVIAAIAQASSKIAAALFEMPDSLFVSFDQWARLVSLCDSTGRQVFPHAGPVNAAGSAGNVTEMGMNVLGLNLVADANLPAGTMIVGRSDCLETYETFGGQLSIVSPSTLSVDLALYGYFASTSVEDNAFVALKPGA